MKKWLLLGFILLIGCTSVKVSSSKSNKNNPITKTDILLQSFLKLERPDNLIKGKTIDKKAGAGFKMHQFMSVEIEQMDKVKKNSDASKSARECLLAIHNRVLRISLIHYLTKHNKWPSDLYFLYEEEVNKRSKNWISLYRRLLLNTNTKAMLGEFYKPCKKAGFPVPFQKKPLLK